MILAAKRLVAQVDMRLPGARSINGVPVSLGRASELGFSRLRDNAYEPEEWRCMQRYCHAGNVVLDVGANIGILSIFFSRLVGAGGRVWAFEPNPHTFPRLIENLRLNGCENVMAVQSLVSEKAGVSDFYVAPWGRFNPMSAMLPLDERAQRITTPTLALDDLLPSVDRVDYVKVDVEGAEVRVLMGAAGIMERFRPAVQVEVHGMYMDAFGTNVAALFELMAERGYAAINVMDFRPTTVAEFTSDTKLHVPHPLTGADLAYLGYGQLLFLPEGYPA
jgi:FkbM family methyltransferase